VLRSNLTWRPSRDIEVQAFCSHSAQRPNSKIHHTADHIVVLRFDEVIVKAGRSRRSLIVTGPCATRGKIGRQPDKSHGMY
jgi:hypothetical protein